VGKGDCLDGGKAAPDLCPEALRSLLPADLRSVAQSHHHPSKKGTSMTPTEHPPNTPSHRTGIFALLRGLLRVKGSGLSKISLNNPRSLFLTPVKLSLASVLALATTLGALALSATPALAAGDANTASCPASTESSPGFRTYLPDCRAYELVTKLNKGGLSVEYGWANSATSPPYNSNLYFASADGRHVMFGLDGGPEAQSGEPGETYVAARTAGGWESTELSPPEGVEHPSYALLGGSLGAAVFSDVIGGDFMRPVFQVLGAAESKPSESSQNLYEGGSGGSLTLLSNGSLAPNGTDTGGAWYAGQSADGSHILFFSRAILEPQAQGLITERDVNGYPYELYDRSGGQTHVVGLLPDTSLETHGVALGGGGGEAGGVGETPYLQGQLWSSDHAVSKNGSRIFFQNRVSPTQVYVRENDTVTKEISLSQKTGEVGTPSNGAYFLWASADGSKVLFRSGSQLTNDATAGGGMYEYDFESHALRFLTPDATDANGAEVPSNAVVGASDDGSRIYFVANGKLEGPGLGGKGTTGQPNLYLYEPKTPAGVANPEPLRFVATLSASDQLTENLEGVPNVRVTADGRYIVVVSHAKLTSYENGGYAEIYRYDAEATTKPLLCVSCDPGSEPPVADASLNRLPFGPPTYLKVSSSVFSPSRNISADGSMVFFETAEPLLPQAVNGKVNVYEWHNGQLALISDGSGPENAHIYDVSASGSDVFFTTYDKLTPQDGDGALDVYDARIGGGLPAPPPPAPRCSSEEECRGALGTLPVFGAPSSTTFSGTGNLTPALSKPAAKPLTQAQKLARALKACKRKPRKRRASCVKHAKRRFAARSQATKSSGRGK